MVTFSELFGPDLEMGLLEAVVVVALVVRGVVMVIPSGHYWYPDQ